MNTKIFKENCNIPLSVNYAFHKYGGLQKICDELNIPFSRTNELDINILKDDIMRVYQEQGKMTVEIYQKYGQYSSSCIKHHFGGFNKMLEQLNLPINTYKNVTKDDVINDIKIFYDKYNTTSNSKYRLYGKYSESTIKNLFGSWENLMNEMKLPYLGQTYGQDEIIRQVRRVYDKYGYISKVLIDEECSFTYQALQYYFKAASEYSQNPNERNRLKWNEARDYLKVTSPNSPSLRESCALYDKQLFDNDPTRVEFLDSAIIFYSESVVRSPTDANKHANLALLLLRAQREKEAMGQIDKALFYDGITTHKDRKIPPEIRTEFQTLRSRFQEVI